MTLCRDVQGSGEKAKALRTAEGLPAISVVGVDHHCLPFQRLSLPIPPIPFEERQKLLFDVLQ